MRPGTFIQRRTSLKRGGKLRARADTDTNRIKEDIQETVRAIVIARDGGCVARNAFWHRCGGYRKDGQLILQADHLLTRANAATYSDTRLIVCVCKGLHGWKQYNKEEYDQRIRPLIGEARCELWDKMHDERYKPRRMTTYDWNLELAALKQEYARITNKS